MHPAMVAPHLTEFAQARCQALHDIRDNEEKDSAFRGLCQLVHVNPSRICKVRSILEQVFVTSVNLFLQSLLWFRNAIVRWQTPSQELNHAFSQIL